MKKIVLITFVLMICIGITTSVFAAELTTASERCVPLYTNAAVVDSFIAINNGHANGEVSVYGKSGTTKIAVNMSLQKKTGKTWSNVKSWSGTKNDSSYTLTKSKSVGKGTYRVKGAIKVYKGKNCETITKYSGTVKY